MKNSLQADIHNYKLIVFDIDGTLVGSSHELDAYTKDILMRMKERGIRFTLATGKNLPATKPLADELEIDLPLILSNGGMVETRFREVVDQSTLPLKVTEKVIGICDERNKDLVFYIGNLIVMKQMNENIFPIYSNVENGLVEVGEWKTILDQLAGANKCLVVDRFNQKNLFDLEKIFKKEIGGGADILHTSNQLLEVIPLGVTKVTGIEILAGMLNIQMEEVMAFGDYDNDVQMLSAVGLGVAVANASEAAKESADLIIGSCEENGVANFLNLLIGG